MNKWEETRLLNLKRKQCFDDLDEVEMKHFLRLMAKKAAEKSKQPNGAGKTSQRPPLRRRPSSPDNARNYFDA